MFYAKEKRGIRMNEEKNVTDKKQRLYIIIGVIIGVLVISVLLAIIFRSKEESYLESVYYAIQIISALFVIGGVVIAVWQYILTSRRENELKEEQLEEVKRVRSKEAIELTQFYKDNIINKISIITKVYKETKILAILDKIKIDSMKNFDVGELNSVLSQADREEIEKIRMSKEFENVILSHADYFDIDLNKVSEEDKDMVEKIVINQFKVLSQQLLNNLEYFAISFNCKIAEEKIIYQSLHQTYIRIVSHMYYEISKNNKTGEQKLYTNVIDLFNIWNNRAKEQKDREADAIRSVIKKNI